MATGRPKDFVLKDLEIFLDKDRKTYEMGEKIHGKLRVSFTGELHLISLKIGIVCMSKIKHSDETFDQKKLLDTFYELPKEVSSQVLKTGTHEIPFRFPLPDDNESPPSFDGRYGCINYFVECLIEDQDDQELHRYGVEVKLEQPVQKNLMLSVSGISEKDLGLFCIGSGNAMMEASIARKGHVAGEPIRLRTLINNATTLKVQPRATLYQTQIFMSGEKHRTLEMVLGEPKYGSEIDPTEVIEDIIEIPIPARAQLTMKSTILTIKYFVHVTLDIPHNIDLHINLPIVVTNKNAMKRAQQTEPDAEFARVDSMKNRHRHSQRRTKRMGSKTSTGSSNIDDDDDDF